MNTIDKLQVLGGGTKWDACAPSSSYRKQIKENRVGSALSAGVCKSYTPDGRCVSLFKVLQSNSCIHDCKYCMHSTSCSRKEQKTEFGANELAGLFMHMYLRNYVEGLFLTSSVCGNETIAFEKMYETVKVLREKYNYEGYIHLKVMPGAHESEIKALAEYADRLSLNIESTCEQSFSEICSTKDYETDIERRLRIIEKVKGRNEVSSGVTTQMIVGAAEEKDIDYIGKLEKLYEDYNLKKAYFSAFDAVQGTPLEKQKSIPLRRENFLYRIDWLLRFYHFSFDEVKSIVNEEGMLSLSTDPKLEFALRNPALFPVDVNNANFDELIKVPGIGLQGAQKIVNLREQRKIKEAEIKLLNISKKSLPFIQLEGARQSRIAEFS